MMQLNAQAGDPRAGIAAGSMSQKPADDVAIPVDPVTLAQLDYGLFRALTRLGTSKQRICSALCLSYAEYDYISSML